jgi:shikimate kinase
VAADKSARAGRRSIAIVGFMGAGKTTIGRRLAERLRMPFADTDREIEKAFGLTIAEIFSQRGEVEFRFAERELVLCLLNDGPRILSLGGGAYVDEQTRAAINRAAKSVWLDPPFDLILGRLARSTTRPLSSGKSSDELRRLWEQRRASYAEAHFHIATSEADPDAAVEQILRTLGYGA